MALLIAACEQDSGPPHAPLSDDKELIYVDTTLVLNSELLVSPWRAVVDSKGRLHVADDRQLVIQSFSSDGKLLGTSGGVGSGPGEFRRLSAFGIHDAGDIEDAHQPLVVFDALNKRLTFIDFDADESHSVPHDHPLPMSLSSAHGGLYAVGFVDQTEDNDGSWIRLIDEHGKATSILSFGRLFATGSTMVSSFERWIMQSTPDRLTPYKDGFLLTPALFRGMHSYIAPTDSGWAEHAQFRAPVWHEEPFSLVDASISPTDVTATVPGDGIHKGNIHNQSRGVHLGAEGVLYHLVELEYDDVLYLVLQVHGPDGVFAGQRILQTQPVGPTGAGYIDAEMTGQSGTNTLYILARRPNPSIVRLRVSFEEEG